ncbi:unnamed protein product [Mytilus coruscus]|uniref:Peptidase A2 domain-containing protein n=1 Tax=Mytilus coruscus TaxID=42192 RepID=A0A6J8E410_MYTCO|nr:unnamed protein product [Mytilus coruscus]
MPTYGRIEEFKFENNFEEYTKKTRRVFPGKINRTMTTRRGQFFHSLWEKTYSLLRNLCAPAKPNTKTFDNLKEVLTDHLRPKPLIIAERYKFHQRKQESHEKTSDNKELKLDVKIGDIDYVMELDTGAAVSIIEKKTTKVLFKYQVTKEQCQIEHLYRRSNYEVEYFAFIVNKDGIQPSPKKSGSFVECTRAGKCEIIAILAWVTKMPTLSLLLGLKTGIPMLAASRIQRWAIQLSGYQYDVKCKLSSENANADGLSRLPLKETLCESPFNIFWEEVEIRNVQALSNYGQCK